MDIIKIIRNRILETYPGISEEELEIRINIVKQMLSTVRVM